MCVMCDLCLIYYKISEGSIRRKKLTDKKIGAKV